MSHEFSLFYTTCPDEATAQKISQVLLEEKLVACTNLFPGMKSQYWWEGKIETAQEVVLILKTRSELKETLQKKFESLHPYQVPCFLEISVESGSVQYLQWLADSVK